MSPDGIDLLAQHASCFAITVGDFRFQSPPSRSKEDASCCQQRTENSKLLYSRLFQFPGIDRLDHFLGTCKDIGIVGQSLIWFTQSLENNSLDARRNASIPEFFPLFGDRERIVVQCASKRIVGHGSHGTQVGVDRRLLFPSQLGARCIPLGSTNSHCRLGGISSLVDVTPSSEVDESNLIVKFDEQVSWGNISVNNPCLVESMERIEHLSNQRYAMWHRCMSFTDILMYFLAIDPRHY